LEASTHQLPHEQFLELAFQDELNVRQQRVIDKRTKAAGFRDHKTLEDFDWTFNPAIKRQQMYELASGQFIRQRRDVLLVGPPGLGIMPGTGLCRAVLRFAPKETTGTAFGPA